MTATAQENIQLAQGEPDTETTAATAQNPAENVTTVEGEGVSGKRKQPQLKSNVWAHFEKLPLEQTNGQHKAKCNYCGALYACHPTKHGTNALRRHLGKCCKNPNKANKQTQSLFSSSNLGSSKTLTHHVFNQERCRKAVAKFLILDEMPFQTVEGEGFVQLLKELEPRFEVPSRTTVSRDCFKLYAEEARNLRRYFKKAKVRVSLTTDTWTSIQNTNYMCLTAHWIDGDWTLQKRILNFCVVENHKGETIGKEIEKCLLYWGVEKVFTITVDNASSNDTAMAFLKKRFRSWNGLVCNGDFLHLRCCAHILNLVVSDGLKEMNKSIEAIRNAVKYVRSSPSRFRRFKELVEKEKIDSKSLLSMDCPTRWNSTYMMLENAIKFSKVFERMEEEDYDYQDYFREKELIGPPNSCDWSDAKDFLVFLKVFYNITLKFSGSLYVTSNECFQQIVSLYTLLTAACGSNFNPLMSDMARRMQSKYNKYWGKVENINPLLVIAVILDPRYKLKYVKFAFEDMFVDAAQCEAMTKKVKDVLYRLYEQYSSGVLDTPQQASASGESSLASTGVSPILVPDHEAIPFLTQTMQRFIASTETELQSEKNAEVDKYLQAELADIRDPKFDILEWWKVNGAKYKVLSLIAHDLLAMPVSTVSSESTFSTGGRVLDSFRSSLSSKMAEALICTQNWISPSIAKLKELDIDNYDDTERVVAEEVVHPDSHISDEDEGEEAMKID